MYNSPVSETEKPKIVSLFIDIRQNNQLNQMELNKQQQST